MKKQTTLKIFATLLFSIISLSLVAQDKLIALKSTETMTLDGYANEAIWAKATWYTIDQLWWGVQPSASDFSGRYKVVWDNNYLYVLTEITDDVLSDTHPDPLDNYWNDDCLEFFLDENRSKGSHENNYNGWASHLSKTGDVVDEGTHKYNDNISMKLREDGKLYTWETRLKIFGEDYKYLGNNTPLTLTAGKVMGFSLAYCDNDGGAERQSFIGSGVVPLADKNVGYKLCDYYQELTLLEKAPELPTLPGKIEAENFTTMSGVQIEKCTDIGMGEDVGYIDTNDYLTYNLNVLRTGNYRVNFRLASPNDNSKMELFANDVSLGTITAAVKTGSWTTWGDYYMASEVYLTAGPQTIKIVARTTGFNFNWMYFDYPISLEDNNIASELSIYPNPAESILNISTNSDPIDELYIYNIDGIELYHRSNLDAVAQINLQQLNFKGVAFVKMKTNNKFVVQKVIVK